MYKSQYIKSRLSLIVRVNVVLNRTVVVDSDWRFDNLCGSHLQSQRLQQQQQSYSGLSSPGRSNSTYFWNDSWVQTFHKSQYMLMSSFAATKVEQANKFNDPQDDCSILVASDAIGMGLNL